ncbi:MAG: hypothetical protein M1383_02855 [Patescibacteria group bacterium]|nr:hypothetical protein [Patescibacteria group bacterium]
MFKFDLQENEKLLQMHRQTEWVLVKPVLIIFVLLYLPWYLLAKNEIFYEFDRYFFAWVILVLFYGINRYLLWLLNLVLITNKRVVKVKYLSLFKKEITDALMGQIANTSFATTGFFSSLFHFGKLEIKAMGLNEPLVLQNVREPAKIKSFIAKIQQFQNASSSNPAAPRIVQMPRRRIV